MNKIKSLTGKLKEKDCNGYFISSEANISYLTGFTGDSSRLMVSARGTALITDGRYTEQAEMECHKEIEIITWIDDKRYQHETYEKVCRMFEINKLCFEGNQLSYSEYLQLKKGIDNGHLEPLDGIVEEVRKIKSEKEIKNLRKACEITDKALHDTLSFIRPGKTESEITAKLEYNLKINGSQGISFDTIVLSGSRSSLLHGKPENHKIEKGNLLLFDFGGIYEGYHADMSRVFIIGGINKKQKELYDIVANAQYKALNSIKDGAHVKSTIEAAKESIPSEYIDYYYQGIGHGVGLEIHEQPFIKDSSEFIFRENMTITIEPGIYIPGWGGLRIEDTIVVKNEGVDILTKFPKDLIIL